MQSWVNLLVVGPAVKKVVGRLFAILSCFLLLADAIVSSHFPGPRVRNIFHPQGGPLAIDQAYEKSS